MGRIIPQAVFEAPEEKSGPSEASEGVRKRKSDNPKKKSKPKEEAGTSLSFAGRAVFLLVVCSGLYFQFLGTDSGSVKSAGGSQKAPEGPPRALSAADSIDLLMQLNELADLAGKLAAAQKLDEETVIILGESLDAIEAQLPVRDKSDSVLDGLWEMILTVRGQIYAKGLGLSDEELEKKYNLTTYSSPTHWDDHYTRNQDEEFDWYLDWDKKEANTTLKDVFLHPESSMFLGDPADKKMMILGSGNSLVSEKLHGAGWGDITNIDISKVVIDQMQQRYPAEKYPGMNWLVMDANKLEFEDDSLDAVVDKGTLDAMQVNIDVLKPIQEVYRTLKPGGTFTSVTFDPATKRVGQMQKANDAWASCSSLTIQKETSLGESFVFVHKCVK